MPGWIMLKICDSILCPLFPMLLIVDIAARINMRKGNDLLVRENQRKFIVKKNNTCIKCPFLFYHIYSV